MGECPVNVESVWGRNPREGGMQTQFVERRFQLTKDANEMRLQNVSSQFELFQFTAATTILMIGGAASEKVVKNQKSEGLLAAVFLIRCEKLAIAQKHGDLTHSALQWALTKDLDQNVGKPVRRVSDAQRGPMTLRLQHDIVPAGAHQSDCFVFECVGCGRGRSERKIV